MKQVGKVDVAVEDSEEVGAVHQNARLLLTRHERRHATQPGNARAAAGRGLIAESATRRTRALAPRISFRITPALPN